MLSAAGEHESTGRVLGEEKGAIAVVAVVSEVSAIRKPELVASSPDGRMLKEAIGLPATAVGRRTRI